MTDAVLIPENLIGMAYNQAWLSAGGASQRFNKKTSKLESLLLKPEDNFKITSRRQAADVVALAGCYEPNVQYSDGRNIFTDSTYVHEESKPGFFKRLKTNHPYVHKALVIGTIIATLGLAATLGASLAKDAHAEKGSEGKAGGRESPEPVVLDKDAKWPTVLQNTAISDSYVSWEKSEYPLASKLVGIGSSFDKKLDIAPMGIYGQNAVYTFGGEVYLYNITNEMKTGPLTNHSKVGYTDYANIFGDSVTYITSDGLRLLNIKTNDDKLLVKDSSINNATRCMPWFAENGGSIVYQSYADIDKVNLTSNKIEKLSAIDSKYGISTEAGLLCANGDKVAYSSESQSGIDSYIADMSKKITNKLAKPCIFSGGKAVYLENNILYLADLESLIEAAIQPPAKKPARYALIDDVHWGESGAESRFHRMVNEIIKWSPKPDGVILGGDNVHGGYGEKGKELYAGLKEDLKPLADHDIPVYWINGNHDMGSINEKGSYKPYFGSPSDIFSTERIQNYMDASGSMNLIGNPIVTVNYAIMGMDSGHETVDAAHPDNVRLSGYENHQIQWLENTLKSSDINGKTIIIVSHAPGYTGLVNKGTISKNQEQYLGLLKEYKVSVEASGHRHQNSLNEKDGTRFYTTASLVSQGAWRNITIMETDGKWSVSVSPTQTLGKIVSAKTACPVELQLYEKNAETNPDTESVTEWDDNGSLISEISADFRPGLEIRAAGTKDARNSNYSIDIRFNDGSDSVAGTGISLEEKISKGDVHKFNVDKIAAGETDAGKILTKGSARQKSTPFGAELLAAVVPVAVGIKKLFRRRKASAL